MKENQIKSKVIYHPPQGIAIDLLTELGGVRRDKVPVFDTNFGMDLVSKTAKINKVPGSTVEILPRDLPPNVQFPHVCFLPVAYRRTIAYRGHKAAVIVH